MITRWRALGVSFALTLAAGLALAQQSTVGGYSARPRFQSVTVTGAVNAGAVTSTNQINIGPSGSSSYLKATAPAGTNIATYQEWYRTNGSTRRGYVGYAANNDDTLTLTNQEANANLDLITNGTGAVRVNGQPIAGPISAGTYTPTLTNGTNVASSTSAQCQYLRVGNVVTVSGAIFVDTTTGSTSTIIDISLPIASALSIHSNLAGGGSSSANGTPLNIQAQTVTDTARVLYLSDASGANLEMTFTFTYVVL